VGSLVGTALFAILFPLGMWALFRFSQRAPEVDGNGAVLRYGPAIAVLGWVCFAIGVGMLGAIAVGELTGEPAFVFVVVAGPGLAFAVAGVWFLRAHHSEYVRFSSAGIEGCSGWGARPVSLGWAEIEHVDFRPRMGYLVLRSRDDRVVRVSPLMSGTDDLVRLLARRVQADGVVSDVGAFLQYRAAYGGGSKR